MIQSNDTQKIDKKKYHFMVAIIAILLLIIGIFWNPFIHEEENSIPGSNLSSIPINNNLYVYVFNKQLYSDKQNIVYTNELHPSIVLEFASDFNNDKFVELFLDGSLNIFGDEFYGTTEFLPKGKMKFTPDFVIVPGTHELLIKHGDAKGKIVESKFNFVLAYHETFEKSIEKSQSWVLPKDTPPEWFQISNGKLTIIPVSDAKHASLAFLYATQGDLSIDFELIPLGENVSTVLYLIDSVRNEFVIGSNNNKRNLLYHRTLNGTERIDGKEFLLEKRGRYHIKLDLRENEYVLFIKKLELNELVDPSLSIDNFKQIISYYDTDKDRSKSTIPDYLGISLWQNSDGVIIDDIFISYFGNGNKK